MIRSAPRALTWPRSIARSRGASALAAGRCRRRSSLPGISPFTRHGVAARRGTARILAWVARAATSALGSASWRSASSSARPTGSSSTFTSTRSSNGPDSRARYRRRASGVHLQAEPADVIRAQAHGLAASTSVNRAGKHAVNRRPGDHHLARFQRLAQRVQHIPVELRSLV